MRWRRRGRCWLSSVVGADIAGLNGWRKPLSGDGSRADFAYDAEANVYVCPGGKELKKYHRNFSNPREGLTKAGSLPTSPASTTATPARSSRHCCPNTPARKVTRSIHEERPRHGPRHRQDRRLLDLTPPAEEGRDAVRPPQTHPEARPIATTRALRRAREFLLAATAQNLRKLAKLIPPRRRSSPHEAERPIFAWLTAAPDAHRRRLAEGFFNEIRK